MRIACISTSAVPANTANSIQLMKVAHALQQTGATVQLFIPIKSGQPLPDWEELKAFYGLEQSFAITPLPAHSRLKRYDFAWRAVGEAQHWQVEGIYTWLPQAALLALWRRLPVILEIHDLPTGKLGPWLLRQVIQHPGKKRLLIITHALQQALEERLHLKIRPAEVLISPNGIEWHQYVSLPAAEEARRLLKFVSQPTVMTTGHLYAGRGAALFLDLAARFPHLQFIWVGGRPEDVTRWREITRQRQLENVTFTGFIPQSNLPLYQAAADILLMPYERTIAGSSGGNSASVCSPMKMFDYLAAGRAILTSDLPVLREVLNNDNAMFCQPDDVADWSAALDRLVNDPVLRQRLAARARQDARQYTWQARAANALQGFLP